ncbi:MAG: cell division protein FtsL [Gammaproteobacteria bacterium]|nr:cell division protein FtsL [Gammaproteobacteria bacterium]
MRLGNMIFMILLGLVVVVSATGVVYAKYASRRHFVELESLRAQRDAIDVEWGRLQLEQSTWATHGRVERIAREKLNMRIPLVEEVKVIRP